MTILLSVLAPGLLLGVLAALGLLAHLGWYWWTGQDERTPQERAWEDGADSGLEGAVSPAHS